MTEDFVHPLLLIFVSIPVLILTNKAIKKQYWEDNLNQWEDNLNQKVSIYGLRALSIFILIVGFALLLSHV